MVLQSFDFHGALLPVIAYHLHGIVSGRHHFAVRTDHPVSGEYRKRLASVESEYKRLDGCPYHPEGVSAHLYTLRKPLYGFRSGNGLPLRRPAALKIVHFDGIVRMENHHILLFVSGEIIYVRSEKHLLSDIHRERIHEASQTVYQIQFRT